MVPAWTISMHDNWYCLLFSPNFASRDFGSTYGRTGTRLRLVVVVCWRPAEPYLEPYFNDALIVVDSVVLHLDPCWSIISHHAIGCFHSHCSCTIVKYSSFTVLALSPNLQTLGFSATRDCTSGYQIVNSSLHTLARVFVVIGVKLSLINVVDI